MVSAPPEESPVEADLEVPAGRGRSVDLFTVATVFLWLWLLSLSAAQEFLPQEAKDIINTLYGSVGVGLGVQALINDKLKR